MNKQETKAFKAFKQDYKAKPSARIAEVKRGMVNLNIELNDDHFLFVDCVFKSITLFKGVVNPCIAEKWNYDADPTVQNLHTVLNTLDILYNLQPV